MAWTRARVYKDLNVIYNACTEVYMKLNQRVLDCPRGCGGDDTERERCDSCKADVQDITKFNEIAKLLSRALSIL